MSDPEGFTKDMQENAARCVEEYGHSYSNPLDYSVNSLEVVDALLEDASDVFEDLEEHVQKKLVTLFGCYIFEVARSNFGGSYFWYDKLDQPILVTGLPDFEISITAFEKVKGRLVNGAEDNIPFYFEGYADRVKKAKKGEKAYIV
ncbi:MAG TPA: hypothetical protein VI112_06290 [Bacteroidia bacterium]|jgi:hypothetical protein